MARSRISPLGATLVVLACLLGLSLVSPASAAGWESLDSLLAAAVTGHTAPGIQALVADHTGVLYHKSFGNFTYGTLPPHNHNNPPVTFTTVFDMASVTKVMATTTASMLLYDRGLLHLDMKLTDPSLLGPLFGQNGKGDITVRNLLLHNAGFPPDPVPGYGAKSFGCPESSKFHPGLSFTCIPLIFNAVLQQKLENPIGQVYIYSDLSMITLAYALGHIVETHRLVQRSDLLPLCAHTLGNEPAWHCYFEAFVRLHIVKKLNMAHSGFLLQPLKYSTAMPSWNDTSYRHEEIQGVVSDENAYASGGYAGHAGLWSNTLDTYQLDKALMFGGDSFVKQSTVALFTKIYNVTQSSRALGWDTNDYTMNTYRGCNTLSPQTYMHLGYTGTMTCSDPVRKLIAILLTNRTWPGQTTSVPEIKALRQAFTKQVQEIFDAGHFTPEIHESAFFLKK